MWSGSRKKSGTEVLVDILFTLGLGLVVSLIISLNGGSSSHDRACRSYRADERHLATPAFPNPGSLPDGADVGVREVELLRQQKHDTLVTNHPDCFSPQQVQAAAARLQTTTP
ncbi:hypothetical protein GCM10023196_061400 [Actinoallomurus vinaceus]|uniref:Uncharacterized protein n=1 Tax=Actinoallomurus vinaceus TaxID=1080074 RepID=A0ABP8UIS6_9ACTN